MLLDNFTSAMLSHLIPHTTLTRSWPLGVFVGFKHHRKVCIFGAVLLYDETSDSFCWLFEAFLEAHRQKKAVTIITDQDASDGECTKRCYARSIS